ncbi:MAG: hypothetical protein MJ252_20910 [archaeon]|nr:hypothetical protein [archaeon]
MKTPSKSDIILSEIFSTSDIAKIQKESIDYIDEDNTLVGRDSINKDKFIKLLFKIIKGKFKQNGEEGMIPFINWLENEKKSEGDKYQRTLSQENEQLKKYLKWIEDNCVLKFKTTGYFNKSYITNGNYKNQNLTIKDVKKIIQSKENMSPTQNGPIAIYNNNIIKNNQSGPIQLIKISEEAINNFETPDFDIFKLEKEVGPENTLTVVGCYIFSAYGLYSIIDYKKFEKYFQIITRGYIRENPYHNVKYI